MRPRKGLSWKKSRTFGQVFGGRMRRMVPGGVLRRFHSLAPPGPGQATPIVVEDNPSRDWFFPLRAADCMNVLRSLPGDDWRDVTHVWLRRLRGADARSRHPLAHFICGSGVRLVVLYAWPVDCRLPLGRTRPAGAFARELVQRGARIVGEAGRWCAEFDAEQAREYVAHVLRHEIGHNVDERRRRWSPANRKQAEDAAEDYARRATRDGRRRSGT